MKDLKVYETYNNLMIQLIEIKEKIILLQKERNFLIDKSFLLDKDLDGQINAVKYSISHFKREMEFLENEIEKFRRAFDIEKIKPLPIT